MCILQSLNALTNTIIKILNAYNITSHGIGGGVILEISSTGYLFNRSKLDFWCKAVSMSMPYFGKKLRTSLLGIVNSL